LVVRTILRWLVRGVIALLLLLVVGAVGVVGAAALRETGNRTELAPSTGRYVRALDVELFIQEAGPPGGPLVLLVHGVGAWSEIWRETMKRLAESGYRAIAVDVPPFGFSERPESGDYTTATQGRRLAALIQTLNGHAITLVGHSFGSRATVEAAMLVPERLRSLVLVDAALGLHDANGQPLASTGSGGAAAAILDIGPLRRPIVAGLLTNPLMSRTLLRQLISRKEAATPERVASFQRPLALKGGTTAMGKWLQWFTRADMPERSGRIESYRSLGVPSLVIWGEVDSLTPLAQGRSVAALLPNARLEVLPGTGHIPAIENPDAFNRAVLAFLGR
jgi:pimeloyl-ACP methyl ester carboxylesterase